MEDSTEKEDFVEESKKSHLLEPSSTSNDGSEDVLLQQNRPGLKTLSSSVNFTGWRVACRKFKPWAIKMASLRKPLWEKAGIFEAVLSSTYEIDKDTYLVLGIAEKWSPSTKSFVFSWGETSITLEDVMVLLGFSVLGLPVFSALDSSGEKIKKRLEEELVKIKEDKMNLVTQSAWISRFMDCNDDELEHVAFLVYWLSYFVFPLRYDHIYEAIIPIAVHFSIGTRIALAPAVLAHLYVDLTRLKNHIEAFDESMVTEKTELNALFKLVQVWTWERFKELQPKTNLLLKDEPRLALWHERQRNNIDDVRQILDNSTMDSFEWRPYTKPVENWVFPLFYPEKEMSFPVGPNIDDELVSFARFIKVSELVGIDYMEHYVPDRVASQFGMLQDVPCVVNQKKLSQEEAWDHYNKPIDDMTLTIPSRSALPCATSMFCEWWKKTFQELKSDSEKKQRGGLILADIDDSVPCENLASISDDVDDHDCLIQKQLDISWKESEACPAQKPSSSSSSDEDVGAGNKGQGSGSKKSKKGKGSDKKPAGKVTLHFTDPDWPKDMPEGFTSCEKNWSKENDILREEVTNQGRYELCWSVALRDSIEAALNIKAKKEGKNKHPKLSAQHLVNNVKKLKTGAMRRYEEVTNFLVNDGLVTEDKCKYTGSIFEDGCKHEAPDANTVTKIKGLTHVKGKHINEKELIKLVFKDPLWLR